MNKGIRKIFKAWLGFLRGCVVRFLSPSQAFIKETKYDKTYYKVAYA